MLQTIRERAQGWIAWAIVILITIPFALWGIQSYLGVGSEPVVATVNGIEIKEREFDRRFQETRMRLREQLGAAYRPEMFDDKLMRNQVLDRMIQDLVLLQVSDEMGLRASDQELRTAILSNPSFQREGRFDNAAYERALELQGMRPSQFEDSLRQRIVSTQLFRAVTSSEFITDAQLAEAVRLQRQQRNVTFVRIPKSGFLTDDPIAEADIQSYFEQNQPRFRTPERVKLQYLVLDAEALGTAKTASEDELRQVYESEIDRFRKSERRQVRHILVTVPADADSAAQEAAKTKSEEIRARIEAGEDFAEVAKETSEDPGSAGQGGDLGLIEQGLMDPGFDQAAFSLEEGALSEPVRSQFGYHLIQVTKIERGEVKPFEEVKDQLAGEAAKRGAEGAFFDQAERLANLAYEHPDSLAPAAEALGLQLNMSEWIDRTGGEGVLANPKVVGAAFSDEVLKDGLNSELIEPEPNVLQAIVLRVSEHEEASTKPLDQVRDEIVKVLREQRASEAAQAAAADMVKRLDTGADLATVASDYEVNDLGLVGRDAPNVPPGVRDLAFTMARPAEGAATHGSQSLENGDAAVVVVSEVADGGIAGLDQAALDREKQNIRQTVGGTYYDELLSDLESRSKIERKSLEGAAAE